MVIGKRAPRFVPLANFQMARSLTLVLTSCLLAFLSWALLLGHRHYNASPRARERPNIVFIFTDDQDAAMDSLAYMPFVQTHITDHGISYLKHFCTVALCCPSRATVWSGQAAHNTNVCSACSYSFSHVEQDSISFSI